MFRKRLYKTQHPESLAGQSKALALKEFGFYQFSRFSQNWKRDFLGRRGGALSAEDFGRRRRGGALFPQLFGGTLPVFSGKFSRTFAFSRKCRNWTSRRTWTSFTIFSWSRAVLRFFPLVLDRPFQALLETSEFPEFFDEKFGHLRGQILDVEAAVIDVEPRPDRRRDVPGLRLPIFQGHAGVRRGVQGEFHELFFLRLGWRLSGPPV